MNTILNHLKNQRLLWQGNDYIPFPETQSTGFIEFDQQLNGGFPEQGIVEIDSATGIGELRLLLPFLSNKLQQDQRLIVFIGLPVVLNAEALQQQNISLSQVLVINPNTAKDALWAAEQCLKSGCCSNVLLWHSALTVHQVKRLQLAAQQGNALQFVFKTKNQTGLSLPLSLSLQLQPHSQGIQVKIRKQRGGAAKPAFMIKMQSHWPELVLPVKTNNVVHFPSSKAG